MTRIALTYFASLREPRGQRRLCTWQALCRWLSSPVVSADKHDVAGFSVATYVGDRRSSANVEHVFAIGLDLDTGVSLDALRARFAGTKAMVHTTWSSTLAEPRARVFLALSRSVNRGEYRRVYQAVVGTCEAGGLLVDRAASDPSRFWFRPAIQAEGSAFVSWQVEGQPVDVEAALAAVPEPTAPPVPPPSGPRAAGGGDVEGRAAAYVEKVGPAISGSGGRTTTFVLAQRLVRGFALDEDTTYRLMAKWNQTCDPPWSERELRGKIREAANAGRQAVGDLRDAKREDRR